MTLRLLALAAVLPLAAAAQAPPPATTRSGQELLRELDAIPDITTRDKPFEVAASLGKLYYANGRFSEAAGVLGQAAEKGEPARRAWLEQSKKARARKLDLPTADEAGCAPPTAELATQLARVQELAKSAQVGPAATCARLAVRPVTEIRNLLAAAQFHAGVAQAALKTAEATLEAVPDDPEAVYFHASLLYETGGEDVAALRRAKEGFERYAQLRPRTDRAGWVLKLAARAEQGIAAGGLSKIPRGAPPQGALPPGHPPLAAAPAPPQPGQAAPPPLSQETMDAFGKVERTPELLAHLAQTVETAEQHLAQGRLDDALTAYKQVMPLQPENGRMRAGMAWTLVKLGKQPMADNVWNVAVRSDPASVDALGRRLLALGDVAGAKAVWSRLAQSDAEYAARTDLARRAQ